MSHFTVGVFTNENVTPEILEEIVAKTLEPFDVDTEVPHIITKGELIAQHKAYVKRVEDIAYSSYLEDPEAYKEKAGAEGKEHVAFLEEKVPQMLKYTDKEHYQAMLEHYDDPSLTEDGGVRSSVNPAGKFDWFVIGGRWKNSIPLKNGQVAPLFAKVSDINFASDPDAHRQALRKWALLFEGAQPENKEEEAYVEKEKPMAFMYKANFENDDAFAEDTARFSTFAYVTHDHKWFERGQMGSFGMHSATEESKKTYVKHWNDVLETYKDGTFILVDCHS